MDLTEYTILCDAAVVSLQHRINQTFLPLLFEEIDRYFSQHEITAPSLLPYIVVWYDSEACGDDIDAGVDTCDLEVACPIP